ncbi:acyl-CoA dehydrogenase [Microbacterium sp. BDGP8]|uniref:acyl-CoA dehydrogenase n=1 Tax=Microbacterium sp. BDGP8 TaxID=3035531 RepID=UPI00249F1EDA|nr:acyl-CoA dehydrogenase [Microbacterium sp. BDGP8]WHE35769.1 acyl-CoA dehydrogenase [Microbacterium sp. BDGP8]
MPAHRDPRTSPLLAERPLNHGITRALDAAEIIDGFGTDVAATLDWAVAVGAARPAERPVVDDWSLLASVASVDVAAARILEPHLDALDILDQAHRLDVNVDVALESIGASANSTWGVFAAEAPGMRLDAHRAADGWRLSGTKPWCSLAGQLTHALVTAWVGDDRRLFAVALRPPEVVPHTGPWHARGLPQVVSAPVDFADAPAVPIGEAGWYLRRPGFAHGGIGVAACWWGGALPLRDALLEATRRPGADQLSRVHLARVDTALWNARLALKAAATIIDADPDPAMIAGRVRAIVSDAVETALTESARALGPLPLVADESHARRVADLQIYIRQHHGERDLARLGGSVSEGRGQW